MSRLYNFGFRIGFAELAFGSVVDFGLFRILILLAFLAFNPQSQIRIPQLGILFTFKNSYILYVKVRLT